MLNHHHASRTTTLRGISAIMDNTRTSFSVTSASSIPQNFITSGATIGIDEHGSPLRRHTFSPVHDRE